MTLGTLPRAHFPYIAVVQATSLTRVGEMNPAWMPWNIAKNALHLACPPMKPANNVESDI